MSPTSRPFSRRTLTAILTADQDKVNYELVASLVYHVITNNIHNDGSILVFLPGLAEIVECMNYINQQPDLDSRKLIIVPLHSSLSSQDQHKCFLTAPKGMTKVVLSTNIAETSLTIDDVTVVIDGGKMKELGYDAKTNMTSLLTTWVTQANAKQRAGRAGRVREGVCYHLYTRPHYNTLPAQPVPEMLRAPLEALCLHVKILGYPNVEQLLLQAIQPPKRSAIKHTMKMLTSLKAIEEQGELLTPLGYHLASLPVDVRIGKMLLYACVLGCIDSVMTVAACISGKSPFYAPFDERDQVCVVLV